MPDIESERDRHKILSWDMQPGDVLAFSAMTVHGAPANRDRSRRRRGYTVRYTGDDAVYQETVGTSKPLFTDSLSNGDPIGGDRVSAVDLTLAGGLSCTWPRVAIDSISKLLALDITDG